MVHRPQQRSFRGCALLVPLMAGLLLWPAGATGQAVSLPVPAATASGSPRVLVDGRSVAFDVPPAIEDGRTLVPVRAIMEALGATVTWDAAAQIVTATRAGFEVKLAIGHPIALVNGLPVQLDMPARISGGRTLVPLRFLSERLGYNVGWDGGTGTIHINTVAPPAHSVLPRTDTTPPRTDTTPPRTDTKATRTDTKAPEPGPGSAPAASLRFVSASPEPIKGPQPTGNTVVQDNPFRSLTISHRDPNVVFMGSEGNGIFKSSDGGRAWQWLRTGLRYTLGFGTYPEIYDIAIDPENESRVMAATTNGPGPPSGDYPSAVGGAYLSTDGGLTWQQRNNGLTNGAANAVAIHPRNPKFMLISTDGGPVSFSGTDASGKPFPGGLWSSTDAGETWRQAPLPDKALTNRFYEIYIRGGNPGRIYATGTRWTPTGPGQPSRPDLAGSLGLIRSDDGGATWQGINPGNSFITRFDVTDDGTTIYALAEAQNGVLYSADGGNTWQARSTPAARVIKVGPGDGRTVFLAGFDGALYKSTDGLGTVKRVLAVDNPIAEIEVARSDPKVVYVSVQGLEVYRSSDGGETFRRMVNLRDFINAQ